MIEAYKDFKDWLTPKRALGALALAGTLAYVGFAAHEDVRQQHERNRTHIESVTNLSSKELPADD